MVRWKMRGILTERKSRAPQRPAKKRENKKHDKTELDELHRVLHSKVKIHVRQEMSSLKKNDTLALALVTIGRSSEICSRYFEKKRPKSPDPLPDVGYIREASPRRPSLLPISFICPAGPRLRFSDGLSANQIRAVTGFKKLILFFFNVSMNSFIHNRFPEPHHLLIVYLCDHF